MQNHINCVVSELGGEEFSNYLVYVSGNWFFYVTLDLYPGRGCRQFHILFFCRMCNAVCLATEFSLSGHEPTEKTANCVC